MTNFTRMLSSCSDGLAAIRVDRIAGMTVWPHFLPDLAQMQMQREAFKLHEAIQKQAQFAKKAQARTYLSQQHNLPSKETYCLVSVLDERGKKVDAQHFERYGEEGHQLTYFIGNNNMPSFIRDGLIVPMEKLREVESLMEKAEAPLVWNFTFNVYRPCKENPKLLAGFPFHKDVASNGEITAIFTLLSEAEIQMKHESETEPAYSGVLRPGSLFVLSGEARWDWLHRIVPKALPSKTADMSIYRMSLVLGCRLPESKK